MPDPPPKMNGLSGNGGSEVKAQVTDSHVAPTGTRTGGSTDRRRAVTLLVTIAAAIVVLDIISKTLVVKLLPEPKVIDVVGKFVRFFQVRNSGAAFSMATGMTWVLTVIALIVVAVIIRMSSRMSSRWWALGLGLILGGSIGNLIDRFFRAPGPMRGHVVDFISVGHFPVFNIADSGITCGAVCLILLTVLGIETDGSCSRSVSRTRKGGRA